MEIKVINNGKIRYADSLAQQQTFFDEALAQRKAKAPVAHRLIFNEHYPVLTLGKHADPHNILFSREYLEAQQVELFETNRGGDVTYHGPGQWTIYPIFDLEELGIGIRTYVEKLEEVAIQVARHYGVTSKRIPGASGVWVEHPDGSTDKLCAIGIHASRFITMHGIAFNVSTSPSAFRLINPCGFTDKGATNLEIESGRLISMEEAKEQLQIAFSEIFGRPLRF